MFLTSKSKRKRPYVRLSIFHPFGADTDAFNKRYVLINSTFVYSHRLIKKINKNKQTINNCDICIYQKTSPIPFFIYGLQLFS